MTTLLLLHGAGGEDEDQELAEDLARRLGATAHVPSLPPEDFAVDAWTPPITAALAALAADDVVVGHSFGASMLLHVLARREDLPWPVHLLGMPDWGPEGWDVAEYLLTGAVARARLARLPAVLNHAEDDEVVPVHHLDLHRRLLPSARVVRHPSGGHQLIGRRDAVLAAGGPAR